MAVEVLVEPVLLVKNVVVENVFANPIVRTASVVMTAVVVLHAVLVLMVKHAATAFAVGLVPELALEESVDTTEWAETVEPVLLVKDAEVVSVNVTMIVTTEIVVSPLKWPDLSAHLKAVEPAPLVSSALKMACVSPPAPVRLTLLFKILSLCPLSLVLAPLTSPVSVSTINSMISNGSVPSLPGISEMEVLVPTPSKLAALDIK